MIHLAAFIESSGFLSHYFTIRFIAPQPGQKGHPAGRRGGGRDPFLRVC
jgi:hypothetical protein